MLDILTERASELGVEEMVIGMAHRGRLNVMVNIMEMNVRQIFAGFEDDDPEAYVGRGDVKRIALTAGCHFVRASRFITGQIEARCDDR